MGIIVVCAYYTTKTEQKSKFSSTKSSSSQSATQQSTIGNRHLRPQRKTIIRSESGVTQFTDVSKSEHQMPRRKMDPMTIALDQEISKLKNFEYDSSEQ